MNVGNIFNEIIDKLEKASYNHAGYGVDNAIDADKAIGIVEEGLEKYLEQIKSLLK